MLISHKNRAAVARTNKKGYGQSHLVSMIQGWGRSHQDGKTHAWKDLISTNQIVIGARYYNAQVGSIQPSSNGSFVKLNTFGSSRDSIGHGTHTSSTAAGSIVPNANYYGLGQGVAKGGSPSSRVAVYKACFLDNCPSFTIFKAIDDAINDGVDIISISIGTSSVLQTDFLSDPLAIGAFHANQRGVLVICAGGNEGPHPFTVVNTAPWILTIVASSIPYDGYNTRTL